MSVVPSINPNQGGQGAVTFYALDRLVEQQNIQARRALAITMAPITPAIVEVPRESLPSTIIKTLPSIARPSAAGASKVLGSGTCDRLVSRELGAANWLCALGDWVNSNPLLAMGLIAGTYLVTRGK